MIFGTLDTWHSYEKYLPSIFGKVLFFWDSDALLRMPEGRHDIDGDKLYAQVADVVTEPPELRRFELHSEYIDIHLVLAGVEHQLYAREPMSDNKGLLEDRLAEGDVAFYSHPDVSHGVALRGGEYAIYLPGELHCPCCSLSTPTKVRKVVFKIHKNA